MKYRLECVDAGSEYCPCYLAETNNCITCSHLQGKQFCDCEWRGTCIYQEYVNNGYQKTYQREDIPVQVEKRESIGSNCMMLKIKVSKTLARQLKEPGAYVFLRGTDLPHYFDVPMSIMEADDSNGYIYISYQTLGAKTKKLDEDRSEFLLRGPYWNGLYGLKSLKKVSEDNCLVIARGIAQAPAILVIKKLIKNRNKVIFVVDKGVVGEIFIEDLIDGLDIRIIEEDVQSENGKFLIKNILRNEDIGLVYSGGSDVLHASVINMIDQVGVNPNIVITNNNEICCGEGICGGCTIRLSNGVRAKTCKTQLEARKVIERRVFDD
ncbi:dihydroorotate dehydrogenase electron transfer subunit [Gottschalkia purinilytica]|uniref:Dihydroorotate dehydrogenase electron transfer subunit n=1 Tax=Gottschalkia purinilytica TaxID=1503 RepID=A0A0L0W7E3_GOTPU|nr:sulfide/dihydroorotate dehydrogenase-like FAD/NAD-binding protein [Gottschalkia purinilytica]KNF07434.1 dihydroorotate dehydrogenase electron transfer subunit [Gottschalkia purinilytica]